MTFDVEDFGYLEEFQLSERRQVAKRISRVI